MRTVRLRWAAALAVFALTGTACSGIPTTSVPQVISSVNSVRTNTPSPIVPPPRNADPRVIVQRFLDAAAQTSDPSHTDARQYLGPTTANGWKDTTATVISTPVLGSGVDNRGRLTVKASELGTIGSDGVYRPLITPVAQTFVFTLTQNGSGQWRITTLPEAGQAGVLGVLVPESDLGEYYKPWHLYFLTTNASDPTQDSLVPDTRYFAVTDQTLATDLLDQLLAGPQSYLANAVSTEFSDRIAVKRASVALGSTVVVQLPGVSQSDATTVRRLAAQLAWTLGQIQSAANRPIRLQDGTRTVEVAGAATFTMSDFDGFDPAPVGGAPLYYLRPDGALVSNDGSSAQVVTPFVTQSKVTSVAAVTSTGSTTSGAAVYNGSDGGAPGLRVGTLPGTLRAVAVPATPTSRPEWQPGTTQLWLGIGPALYRSTSGGVLRRVALSVGAPGGQVLAVRFSSDGARVALVLRNAAGTASAVWVGGVDTVAGGSARVDGLHQVTPSDWSVTDVAWNEIDSLVAIGTLTGTSEAHVWKVRDDGSTPVVQTTAGLPDGVPDAVAAVPGSPVVVSINSATLWQLDLSGGWAPLGDGGTINGAAPAYRS